MERVNRILAHPVYRECLAKIQKAEETREFCRHDMEHFLAVARLAQLMNLQDGVGIEEELIYASALLHDCGRFLQYEDGTPHEQASARIAPGILRDCGFNSQECDSVTEAILAHRGKAGAKVSQCSLSDLLYRADKLSRNCFACPAQEACNWPEEKKNMILRM